MERTTSTTPAGLYYPSRYHLILCDPAEQGVRARGSDIASIVAELASRTKLTLAREAGIREGQLRTRRLIRHVGKNRARTSGDRLYSLKAHLSRMSLPHSLNR